MSLRVSCTTFLMVHAKHLLLNTAAEKRPKRLRLPWWQTAHTEIKNEKTGRKEAPWDAGRAEDETLGVSPEPNHCEEMPAKSVRSIGEE